MVVRRMLNGRDGIAIEEGRPSYSSSVSLAEIKQDLVDYLDKFEKGSGIIFSVKPLDLTRLHVVAFVQDDTSKEVVQVTSVPVTGKIVFPPVSKPDDSSKKDAKDTQTKKVETPPSTPKQPAKSVQPPKKDASPKADKKKDTPPAAAAGPALTPPATNSKTPPPAEGKAKK